MFPMVGAGFLPPAENDEEKDHGQDKDDRAEGDELFRFGGHGVGFDPGAGRGGIGGVGEGELVVGQGERGELFEFGEECGFFFGIFFEFHFELA